MINTRDVEEFCITRVSSVSQGVRRIFAVTGSRAVEVILFSLGIFLSCLLCFCMSIFFSIHFFLPYFLLSSVIKLLRWFRYQFYHYFIFLSCLLFFSQLSCLLHSVLFIFPDFFHSTCF